MRMNWLRLTGMALGVCSIALGVACGSTRAEAPATEESGTVSTAVSTIGPDGAMYSLPGNSNLIVTRPNGTFITCRSFIGNPTTETFSFPAGTYNLTLSTGCVAPDAGADGGAGIPFTLTRAGDGGATSVPAILQNPVQSVTIAAGGTTPVVFNFAIQGLGTLTFGNGSATVGIATSPAVAAAQPTSGTFGGSFGPTAYTDSSGGTMPALTSLFSSPATVQYNVVMRNLSAFAANFDDEICATFVATITTAAGTPASYQSLFAGELNNANGTICFDDANSSRNANTVAISILRTGPANTPTFQTALLNGADAGNPTATFILTVNAPTPLVYNGYTAALGQFATPVTLPGSFTGVSISSPTKYYGSLGGASTLTLSLAP